MKAFMDKDFLLETETARRLFHSYAKDMPIIDYHCHINPKEIYEDKRFSSISEVWLGGDHYKWRQMRSNGIDERLITGESSDREKFFAWAKTLPKLIGNPLYHWSHMELQQYFDIHTPLSADTAEEIWDACNEALKREDMSVRGIIRRSNVKLICTTDDPADDLIWHRKLAEIKDLGFQVLPAWRPDQAVNLEKETYLAYLERLSEVSGVNITDLPTLKEALLKRMEFFAKNGCVVSDHGLDYVYYHPVSDESAAKILAERLSGNMPSFEEQEAFKTHLMLFLGKEYHRLGWAMQLHYGCKRNNNTKMFRLLGPDTGFDAISNFTPSDKLADFLDALSKEDALPKTILYSLNPSDDAVIDTIMGCFQSSDTAGKVQHGSGWWFNDTKDGMRKQMYSLANLGCLGNFIGMLTDSRSFLSYTRHGYFRRILCQMLGEWVENGEYPADEKSLKSLVEDISYHNARRYFGFQIK